MSKGPRKEKVHLSQEANFGRNLGFENLSLKAWFPLAVHRARARREIASELSGIQQ